MYIGFIGFAAFKNGNSEIGYSGIDITTNVKSDIYIDNQKLGSAQPDPSFLYTKIEPGKKRVRLVDTEDTNLIYEKDLIFEKGTKVSINWSFGVTQNTSYGLLKYFVKKAEDTNKIRIIKDTAASQISVDGKESDDSTITADGNEHTITVSKAGYIPKTLKVSLVNKNLNNPLISQADKTLYDDYDLVVEVALFQIPFTTD